MASSITSSIEGQVRMGSQAEKVRENRLRRAAERQGLRLRKSGRRDPRALDYGVYWLVETWSNRLIEGPGPDRSWPDLDAVEHALS
jgi:hypothetical protein